MSTQPELIHEIVTWLVAGYVDDAIAGPLGMKALPMPDMDETYPDAAGWDKLVNEVVEEDKLLKYPNPITALLRTSFSVREITLKVLSVVLGIPLNEESGRMSRCVTRFLCVRVHR